MMLVLDLLILYAISCGTPSSFIFLLWRMNNLSTNKSKRRGRRVEDAEDDVHWICSNGARDVHAWFMAGSWLMAGFMAVSVHVQLMGSD